MNGFGRNQTRKCLLITILFRVAFLVPTSSAFCIGNQKQRKQHQQQFHVGKQNVMTGHNSETLLHATNPDASSIEVWLLSLPSVVGLDVSLDSKLRKIWTWKDWALGDGRDYFVPRPNALKTLNSIIVESGQGKPVGRMRLSSSPSSIRIEECGILSNCARMDIMLVVTSTNSSSSSSSSSRTNQDNIETMLRNHIAYCVTQQVTEYTQGNNHKLVLDLWPDARVFEKPSRILDPIMVEQLSSAWVVTRGIEDVLRHLCIVAAGLALRPSRPGREVEFRPFSSRDAHILLQLKRTADSVVGTRIASLLVPAALSAGKMARDPERLPEIQSLKGFSMESKRYSQRAPRDVESNAIHAVHAKAIEPTIQTCLEKWHALTAGPAIAQLQRRVAEITPLDHRHVRQMLHQPIMALRRGEAINETQICLDIQEQLSVLVE